MDGFFKDTLSAAIERLENPEAVRVFLTTLTAGSEDIAAAVKRFEIVKLLKKMLEGPLSETAQEAARLTGQRVLADLSPVLMKAVWKAMAVKQR